MQEILELQTGQVAFISGLMSGFSLSIAANVLRTGIRTPMSQVVFVLFLLTSLLFLLSLYTDVRLSIELAGIDTMPQSLAESVSKVRAIGTTCATFALFLFVIAIGLLGWLLTPAVGYISSFIAIITAISLALIWNNINVISQAINALP